MIFIQLYMQQTKSFYGKIEFLTENIKSILNIDYKFEESWMYCLKNELDRD